MSILTGYAIPTGIFGTDHTYAKSDNPAFTWPCWGRSADGREICRGNGNALVANCLSQPNSWAGIIYGVTGVCHQTANRILYPAGITVSGAGGYWLSTLAYGIYGTPVSMPEWLARLLVCTSMGGLSSTNLLAANSMEKGSSPEDRERAYLQKVISMYSKEVGKPKKVDNAIMKSESISLSGEELKLMMEYRLGKSLDPKAISEILKRQADFIAEKHEMDQDLYGADLHGEEYAKRGNDRFGELSRNLAEILGKEQFEKIFGLAPPKGSFSLIDPDIAAKVHSTK